MKLNKPLYYILNLTWGLPLTLIGFIVSAVLLTAGFKPKRWGGCWYFSIGHNWGGLEMGLVFLVDSFESEHLKCHEYGHSIQNMIFGPFNIFLTTIPSVLRYWYRELFYHRRGKIPATPYDSVWFERTATEWGYATVTQWEEI